MVKKKGGAKGLSVGSVDKKKQSEPEKKRPPQDDEKQQPEPKSKKKKKRKQSVTAAAGASTPGPSPSLDSFQEGMDDDDDLELDATDDFLGDQSSSVKTTSKPITHASVDAAALGQAGSLPKSPLETECGQLPPETVLAWLLWPMSLDTFFSEYWEKKPLHLKRNRAEHFDGIFSKQVLDQHLSIGTHLGYEERINLARFDKALGRKVMHNKGERGVPAKAVDVEKAWKAGASIQVMHPQQFHSPVWKLLTALEGSRLQALMGANSYITPGGNQGLAPHYDNVEVFMLQLEGSKRWRLFEPPTGPDTEYPLPREYSRDFIPGELGDPILDCVVTAGDLLYLPRGTVHAGVVEDSAGMSHHLTISTYMKTAWCNLMERALQGAISRAASDSVDFRAGIPEGFLGYMGSWHDCAGGSTENADVVKQRAAFTRKFHELLKRLHDYVDIDDVCDEMGVEFMSQRLPPCLGASAGAVGATNKQDEGSSKAITTTVTLDTQVRWKDASSLRLVMSTDPETSEPTLTLFHSCSNQRVNHMCVDTEAEEDVGVLRFEAGTFLPALRALVNMPPGGYMRCGDLPLKEEDDRTDLCENLCEAGVLECRGDPAHA